ncbi:MAG TPA: hypothetical protein VGP72_10895 [Planctomycetota bacterium]|jgi:hypothetical protein
MVKKWFSIPTLLLCLSAAGSALGGETTGTPADEILALAKASSAPDAAKLREPYLKLQWLRVTGAAPCPKQAAAAPDKDAKDDEERGVHGERSAPLTEDEKTKLKAWFDAKPKFRERFLLAVSATEDDLPNCARVALRLHEKFPKDCEPIENLLLAFCTVWDDEQVLRVLNSMAIPELTPQTIKMCSLEEAFGWYVQNQPKLCPWFKQTPWRLLTYVAADTTELTEREWIFKKHNVFRTNLGTVYSEIEYDMSKVKDANFAGKGKIGGHEYTLANIKQYGGVCRDQAYYARAVCRNFGLPAYMATAVGNSGIGHAWVGWVAIEAAQGYKLFSHGRYASDNYFTANILDPQSGDMILDYLVGIEARGLSDEKSYDDAELYYRVYEENVATLPKQAALNLCIAAVKKNAYHRAAWLAVGDATAAGELPRASGEAQWQYLTAKFKEFPDFTFSMLSRFSKMFKTPMEKYTFYEVTSKLFGGLKRQDLVAKLRLEEIDMCAAENRKDLAAQVALTGLQECAGEGAEDALLAKKAVELLREQKQSQMAVRPLQVALAKTPKLRMKMVNPNWTALTEILRDVYKEIGDTKKADALDADLERTSKSAGN